MELRHLRYFVTLAEELHFGRAAARLHISQPPLSQQVRALEQELNCQLLERNNRSVALTDAGLFFLQEAREILRRADRAKLLAGRAHLGLLGEIDLFMFPSAPLVPEVVAFLKFVRRSTPGVHLALRERASNDVIADLADGKADVAFVRFASFPRVPEGFVAQRVASEPFVAVMSRDHALADSPAPIGLAELSAEPFIHFPANQQYAMSMHFHQLCSDAGFEPVVVHEANDNSMIVAMVGAGFGITLLPRSISRLYLQETHVRELTDDGATSTVWFVHAATPRLPVVRNLVEQYRLFSQAD